MQLLLGVGVVCEGYRRAELGAREEGFDVLDFVAHEDGYAVALFGAEGGQAPSEIIRARICLGVG